MENKGPKPSFFVKRGSEISLSSPAFTEILSAVLLKGSSMRFLAKGFSMAPFILDGDVITLSPFREKSPGVGVVVAFFNPRFEKIMVHRIVGKKGNSFLIRGDNSPGLDGWIEREHIFGRVIKVERGGKKIFLGAGYGNRAIAFLSRWGLLVPLIYPLRKIYRAIAPRSRDQGKHRDNGGDREVFS